MKTSLRIKKIREKNRLSTNSFAEILGISQPTVTRLENEKSLPSAETILAFYEKFQVDPLWLLTGQTRSKITDPDALKIAEMAQKLSNEARQRILEMVERELELEKLKAEQSTKRASTA